MAFSFRPNQPEASQAPATPKAVPLGAMPLADRDPQPSFSLFQKILVGVLILMLLITAGMFGYQYYLLSRIDNQKKILDQKDTELGVINLAEMRVLSNRMKVVSQTLNEHASVRTALTILEKSIENPVTYTRFSLAKSATGDAYDLNISAVAPSYKAVAQQIDTLKSDQYSKDFIPKLTYSGLLPDEKGQIAFDIKMSVLIKGKLPEVTFPGQTIIAPASTSPATVVSSTSVATSTFATSSPSTVMGTLKPK